MSRNSDIPNGLCTRDPARWLDPEQQSATRRLCLSCPRLSLCRNQTLNDKPLHGMWAGVWIDHDFDTKSHLLRPAATQRGLPHPHPPSAACLVSALTITGLSAEAAALVAARASGHCEILAPACLLRQQLIFNRRHDLNFGGDSAPADSPAEALACCENCADLIEHTDVHTALQLGYITTADHPSPLAPVFWRQRRWVLLDHFGHLQPLDAGTAPLARIA
ncbi:WhiB family transcriptional regulator [Mycobacteroides abscessus]|uniref:WhiB family transcriptional regulator n=1 Tax=Mycobacteroides abscessus TaxID=36809 RepID=UPI0013F4736D|nr:WhiB family transcriptional regulator [Mycobacteroides abscessus]MDO3268018.1 WhiB family transcriptional regulator [Mycobacteroides abscessus subsp. abscessus]